MSGAEIGLTVAVCVLGVALIGGVVYVCMTKAGATAAKAA